MCHASCPMVELGEVDLHDAGVLVLRLKFRHEATCDGIGRVVDDAELLGLAALEEVPDCHAVPVEVAVVVAHLERAKGNEGVLEHVLLLEGDVIAVIGVKSLFERAAAVVPLPLLVTGVVFNTTTTAPDGAALTVPSLGETELLPTRSLVDLGDVGSAGAGLEVVEVISGLTAFVGAPHPFLALLLVKVSGVEENALASLGPVGFLRLVHFSVLAADADLIVGTDVAVVVSGEAGH